MGLRARLALFFVAITVVPLTVAVFTLQLQINEQLRQRVNSELSMRRAAAVTAIDLVRSRAADFANDLIQRGGAVVLADADPTAAERWLDAQPLADEIPQRADFVVLVGADGTPLASRMSTPTFADEDGAPELAVEPSVLARAAQTQQSPPGVLLEVRQIRGSDGTGPERILGAVVTGVWLDGELLDRLVAGQRGALVSGGRVLTASGAPRQALQQADFPAADETDVVSLDGRRVRMAVTRLGSLAPGVGDALLLLWSPVVERRPLGPALFLLIPSVLAAGAIGWFLAGSVIAPVRRAASVARAVAAGDLRQTLEPSGGRELGDLASALNSMSAELASRLEEIERSRDELRRSLSRLGQTLSSSLDLNRTLAVVVETAMDTLGADHGALMLLTPERDALYCKVGRGLGERVARVQIGQGLAGHVAQHGVAVRLPADAHAVPSPVPGEPTGPHQLSVPLLGRGRVMGVLALIRTDVARPFSQDDLETIRSFGAQASVAIENVMLHQEAQRLSVTDALTGLWNLRYFQLQADRELESAGRFERPASLVILDIDHFKAVNDRYGHQVGDEVLIEVARRLRDSTRVPDVVARYGGEEFVVLLPGTDRKGAMATAERIRVAVASEPIRISSASGTGALDISCSFGVATFPRHGKTLAGLLRSADAAMYTAKSRGRNRVVGAGASGIVALDGRKRPKKG